MPGQIIHPEIGPLTPDLKQYLLKICNNQPDDVLLHYLQTGEVKIDELDKLQPTRRDILQKQYEAWLNMPDQEELDAWQNIQTALNDPFANQANIGTMLENFIAKYPKSPNRSEAEQKLGDLERERWNNVRNLPEGSLAEMKNKLQQMRSVLDKCRRRLPGAEVSGYESEVNALSERIAREELKPLFNKWDEIVAMPGDSTYDLKRKEQRMQDFLTDNGSKFPRDIFEGFKKQLDDVRARIADMELGDIRYDFDELVKFIRKQSVGSERFKRADEYLWALVTEELDLGILKRFVRHVPNSSHINEAREIIKWLDEWDKVRRTGDIFKVHEYLQRHHDAPTAIYEAAEEEEARLKRAELERMEENPSAFPRRRFLALVSNGIISLDDLLKRGLTTPEAYQQSLNRDEFIRKNPIDVTFVPFEPEGETTDVYLFGVPSTGKTCVLMGLLGSSLYDWNHAVGASDYGEILTAYCDNHILPERTRNTEFFSVHGQVTDAGGRNHLINTIELAGEQFLDKIVMNPSRELSLEDMDAIAAETFKNNNRKIIFIVIDPTVKEIEYKKVIKRTREDGTIDEYEEPHQISQKLVIQKIMDILKNRANLEMMKKVDALHFIATKSDVLDHANKDVREALADYAGSFKKAAELCMPKNAHINEATGFKPKLYTFSLGKFYVGGSFVYDSTDSDKLMNVVAENTLAIRDLSFLEKALDLLNTKII